MMENVQLPKTEDYLAVNRLYPYYDHQLDNRSLPIRCYYASNSNSE
jgi:hypothetical protein